jgi:hypothetical protein
MFEVFQVVSFFRVTQQNPVCISVLPHTATCSAHLLLLLDLTIVITFGKKHQSWSSSLCSCLQSSVTSFLLGQNIFLSTLFSKILSPSVSRNLGDQVSHPYRNSRQNYSFACLNLEDFRHVVKWQQIKSSQIPVSSLRNVWLSRSNASGIVF